MPISNKFSINSISNWGYWRIDKLKFIIQVKN